MKLYTNNVRAINSKGIVINSNRILIPLVSTLKYDNTANVVKNNSKKPLTIIFTEELICLFISK